jgi:hypothetical protein
LYKSCGIPVTTNMTQNFRINPMPIKINRQHDNNPQINAFRRVDDCFTFS